MPACLFVAQYSDSSPATASWTRRTTARRRSFCRATMATSSSLTRTPPCCRAPSAPCSRRQVRCALERVPARSPFGLLAARPPKRCAVRPASWLVFALGHTRCLKTRILGSEWRAGPAQQKSFGARQAQLTRFCASFSCSFATYIFATDRRGISRSAILRAADGRHPVCRNHDAHSGESVRVPVLQVRAVALSRAVISNASSLTRHSDRVRSLFVVVVVVVVVRALRGALCSLSSLTLACARRLSISTRRRRSPSSRLRRRLASIC